MKSQFTKLIVIGEPLCFPLTSNSLLAYHSIYSGLHQKLGINFIHKFDDVALLTSHPRAETKKGLGIVQDNIMEVIGSKRIRSFAYDRSSSPTEHHPLVEVMLQESVTDATFSNSFKMYFEDCKQRSIDTAVLLVDMEEVPILLKSLYNNTIFNHCFYDDKEFNFLMQEARRNWMKPFTFMARMDTCDAAYSC